VRLRVLPAVGLFVFAFRPVPLFNSSRREISLLQIFSVLSSLGGDGMVSLTIFHDASASFHFAIAKLMRRLPISPQFSPVLPNYPQVSPARLHSPQFYSRAILRLPSPGGI
jgi:hypothetical protein